MNRSQDHESDRIRSRYYSVENLPIYWCSCSGKFSYFSILTYNRCSRFLGEGFRESTLWYRDVELNASLLQSRTCLILSDVSLISTRRSHRKEGRSDFLSFETLRFLWYAVSELFESSRAYWSWLSWIRYGGRWISGDREAPFPRSFPRKSLPDRSLLQGYSRENNTWVTLSMTLNHTRSGYPSWGRHHIFSYTSCLSDCGMSSLYCPLLTAFFSLSRISAREILSLSASSRIPCHSRKWDTPHSLRVYIDTHECTLSYPHDPSSDSEALYFLDRGVSSCASDTFSCCSSEFQWWFHDYSPFFQYFGMTPVYSFSLQKTVIRIEFFSEFW